MHSVDHERGIVRLSEYFGVGDLPLPSKYGDRPARFGLRWEGMMELDTDHGMSVCCGPLVEADLWLFTEARRTQLIEEIRSKVSDRVWETIASLLKRDRRERAEVAEGSEEEERIADGKGNKLVSDSRVVGLWAELHLEPLTDTWLAAMAKYAYDVERNDFAFGYLRPSWTIGAKQKVTFFEVGKASKAVERGLRFGQSAAALSLGVFCGNAAPHR